MALTSRRKRPIDRRSKPEPHRDARLFIVATEGRKTEKQYFSMFGNKKCQVHVITNEDNKSAPAYILDQLKEFKKEFQLKEDDELWLMVDVDRWGNKHLGAVAAQAGHNKFNLAVSNPCFEVWLYLHQDDLDHQPITAGEMKQRLQDLLGGYNSSKLDTARYADYIEDAIARAEALDINKDERWPSRTDTHVYKVVEKVKKHNSPVPLNSNNAKLARNVNMYLCQKYTGEKLKDIGRHFGISDSGVSQAGRRVRTWMEKDKSLRREMGKLEKRINPSTMKT